MTIDAGHTVTLAGAVYAEVSFGSGGDLLAASDTDLSVFGTLAGPATGQGTVTIGAGAAFYAAGTVDAAILLDFGGAGATLEVAGQFLGAFAGAIAGFAPGDVIDIISGTATGAAIDGSALTVDDDGAAIGTLSLANDASAGDWLLAAPDMIDGTRLILAAPIPSVFTQAPAGTQSGASFQWAGGGAGQWAATGNWVYADGDPATAAPGAMDSVTIAGPAQSALSLAGDGNAATLATSGIVALTGSFEIGTLVAGAASGDVLALASGGRMLAGGATLDAGVLQVEGQSAALAVTGTLALGSGLGWVADGGALDAVTMTMAGATLQVDAAGSVGVGGSAGLLGSVAIAESGTLAGYGAIRSPLVNNGSVVVSGGVLAIYGSLSGTGTVSVAPSATLYAPYGIAAGEQIVFQPGTLGGTVELFGSASACAAAIIGVMPADVIDIASATISQASWTPPGPDDGGLGVLDLGAAGTLEVALSAQFPAGGRVVQTEADGWGGTMIQLVPCFAAPTRLASPCGPVRAGSVGVGMRLLTRAGAARRVRWIGRRSCDAAFIGAHPELRPVIISAGALGPRRPLRDLTLSPQHGVLLPTPCGPRLIPAVALLNGTTIRRAPSGCVTYVHIELDTHDVLIAEGVEAESFLAGGAERRSLFTWSAGDPAPAQSAGCEPRLEDGFLLAAVRHELGLEAQAGDAPSRPVAGHVDLVVEATSGIHVSGWARGGTADTGTLSVDVMIDGCRAATALANLWRPDLDRGGHESGRSAFRAVLPPGSLRRHARLACVARPVSVARPGAPLRVTGC